MKNQINSTKKNQFTLKMFFFVIFDQIAYNFIFFYMFKI